jgi:hypothetical protein
VIASNDVKYNLKFAFDLQVGTFIVPSSKAETKRLPQYSHLGNTACVGHPLRRALVPSFLMDAGLMARRGEVQKG